MSCTPNAALTPHPSDCLQGPPGDAGALQGWTQRDATAPISLSCTTRSPPSPPGKRTAWGRHLPPPTIGARS